MKKTPLVYIVIINWNGYTDTVECIKSLKKIEYKNYKIVVIDNGSKNKEAAKIKKIFSEIFLIQNNKNLGFSVANNQGINYALKKGADYILLLNNDTVVKPNFLTKLIEYAKRNKFKGILTSKILYFNSNKIWAMGGKLNLTTSIPRMIGQGKPSADYNNIIEPDFATGCVLLVNREVIKKVGKLDIKYFAYYEDADWSYRIKKAGYRIRTIPQSKIWHKVSQSTFQQDLKKIGTIQSYLQARNGLLFGKSNLEGLSKLTYLTAQYLLKFPLYLLYKCETNRARQAYVRGLFDGTLQIFEFSSPSRFIAQPHTYLDN